MSFVSTFEILTLKKGKWEVVSVRQDRTIAIALAEEQLGMDSFQRLR